MARWHDVDAADGTRLRWWSGGDGSAGGSPAEAGVPVVLSNGLGASPAAWPFLDNPAYRAVTWHHRGLGGSARPADEDRIGIGDHADDLLAVMDAAGLERALVVGWSVGVGVAFEAARRAPSRVAGLLVLGGTAGGGFRVLPPRTPEALGRRVSHASAWLLRVVGPPVSGVISLLPRSLDWGSATAAPVPAALLVPPALRTLAEVAREFAGHDWTWFSRLVLAAGEHEPIPVAGLSVPVTVVAGDFDTLAPPEDMTALAAALPDAASVRLVRLPGSHFLPLQFPDALRGELDALARRARPR